MVRTVDVLAGLISGSHVTTDLNVEVVTDNAWLQEAVMLLCGGRWGRVGAGVYINIRGREERVPSRHAILFPWVVPLKEERNSVFKPVRHAMMG